MRKIEIPERNVRLYLPEHLGECNPDQYIDMCELIYRYQCNQIRYDDLRAMAIYRLLNLKKSEKKELIPDDENRWASVYRLSELIDTFFEDVKGAKVIRQEYVNNPVPQFKPLWNPIMAQQIIFQMSHLENIQMG